MSRKDVFSKRMQMLYLLLITLINTLSPWQTTAAGKNKGDSAHLCEVYSAHVMRTDDEFFRSDSGNMHTWFSVSNSIVSDTGRVVRILAIGNSFSEDAVENYLYDLAKAEGISVIIGNTFIGGCSLEKHVLNAINNTPAYQYRKIEQSGTQVNKNNVTLEEAIADEPWDYISVQQVSGNSGQFGTFAASLPTLVKYIEEHSTNTKMRMMLHQTWAYAGNSTHPAFKNYHCSQKEMYRAIVKAVNNAAALVGINIVIPSGTAIQNGRTSFVGDHFNRDGYHLDKKIGRYTAACTWFEKILGRSVIGNSFAPEGMDSLQIAIAQHAAHAAVLRPDKVTKLESYKRFSLRGSN